MMSFYNGCLIFIDVFFFYFECCSVLMYIGVVCFFDGCFDFEEYCYVVVVKFV